MTWRYTPIDKALNEQAILELPVTKDGAIPGSPFLPGVPDSDRYEAEYNEHFGKWFTKIRFQFPPKMVSDGRKTTWEEPTDRAENEPAFAFKYVGARTMTLNWSYVVDSFDTTNTSAWTIPRITHYIRSVRGYALAGRKSGKGNSAADRDLLAHFRLWAIGGSHTQTVRLLSCDVKYSDSIIVPNGNAKGAYPLRADLSVEIRLWTPGDGEAADADPLARVQGLVKLKPVWY